MSSNKHSEYHKARAARELDIGLSCLNVAAARAHLKLASLHLRRFEETRVVHSDRHPAFRQRNAARIRPREGSVMKPLAEQSIAEEALL